MEKPIKTLVLGCGVAALTAAFVVAPVHAGPNTQPNADTDPRLEQEHLKIADGFEINLWASDPMVEKPIEINFDAAGRLWVATSETYPQVKPGQVPNDKVIVLEDTTGSGKADKATIYADHLLIPTGIAPGDGGCYVANSTEVDFLKNTQGNNGPQLGSGDPGTADFRRAILAGFGTEDTHHIIHTFRWGPDGRLYFNQSIYIHSTVETPLGTKRLYGGGVWRFEPQTMRLGVFVTGLVNGWGDAWDRWGTAIGTDGAGGVGINYFIPGAAFTATPNARRVLTGLNPGSPKYASVEVLSGRQMPDDVQGDLITNDFRANRVVRFKLSDDGAGFSAKMQKDFITSTDRAFRPVDVKMGPDGALYIADWYNPIINHGEVDFRDSRRDHVHGRIWRVTAKGRPLVKPPKLVAATIPELLDHLLDPEDWTRLQARLVMRERGSAAVAPELQKWIDSLPQRGLSGDALEHARLEALWTCETIDHVDGQLLQQLLQSPNANARGAAAQVVANWVSALPDPAALLAPLVADENPRVRLEAVRALSAVGTPEAAPLAARALDKPMDRFLEYALYKTCVDLESVWLPAFKSGKLKWETPAQLGFALQAVQSADALGVVIDQLKRGEVSAELRKDVIDLIASVGQPAQVGEMLKIAAFAPGLDDSIRVFALEAAARGARQRKVIPPIVAADLAALIDSRNPLVSAAAMRLAGAAHDVSAAARLRQLAGESDTPEVVRLASIEALTELTPTDARPFFAKLADSANQPQVRAGAVVGLASLDVQQAAPAASDWLTSVPPGTDPAPVLAAFLRRQGGADALAGALNGRSWSPDSAKLALRYLQSIGQDAPALTDVIRKSAGVAAMDPHLSPDQMSALVAEVGAKGDPTRGEQVFRSKTAGCYQCHAIGGAGGALAPDLRAIGASSPMDYIINSVLLPNKDIKDGYDSMIVATKDGDVIQGIKVREDKQDLVLRDNLRDEIVIPQAEIKSRKPGGSLMPSGLADALTHQEFVDLLRFLGELGKPGPWAINDASVVRRWRLLDGSAPASPEAAALPALTGMAWRPDYSNVAGQLPLADLTNPVSFIQAQIDVTTPGKVHLGFNNFSGLTIWVDGQRVEMDRPGTNQSDTNLDLTRGVKTLTIRVDKSRRGSEGIRLDVSDAPGSPAHVLPLGGK